MENTTDRIHYLIFYLGSLVFQSYSADTPNIKDNIFRTICHSLLPINPVVTCVSTVPCWSVIHCFVTSMLTGAAAFKIIH